MDMDVETRREQNRKQAVRLAKETKGFRLGHQHTTNSSPRAAHHTPQAAHTSQDASLTDYQIKHKILIALEHLANDLLTEICGENTKLNCNTPELHKFKKNYFIPYIRAIINKSKGTEQEKSFFLSSFKKKNFKAIKEELKKKIVADKDFIEIKTYLSKPTKSLADVNDEILKKKQKRDTNQPNKVNFPTPKSTRNVALEPPSMFKNVRRLMASREALQQMEQAQKTKKFGKKFGKQDLFKFKEDKNKDFNEKTAIDALINFNGKLKEFGALITDKNAPLKNVKDKYVEKYFGKFANLKRSDDYPKKPEDIQNIINSVNDEEEAITALLNFEDEILKMESSSDSDITKFIKLITDKKAQLDDVRRKNEIYIDEYFKKFVRLKRIGKYPTNKEDIQNIINFVNSVLDQDSKEEAEKFKRKRDIRTEQEKILIDFIINSSKKIIDKHPNDDDFSKEEINALRVGLNNSNVKHLKLFKDVINDEEHTKGYLERLAVACRPKKKKEKSTWDPYGELPSVTATDNNLQNQTTEEKRIIIQKIIKSVNGGIRVAKATRHRKKETSEALENGWRIFFELKRLEKANKKEYEDILEYMKLVNSRGYKIFKIEDEAMKKEVEGVTPSTNKKKKEDPLLAEEAKFMFNQAIHDEIRNVYEEKLTQAEKEIFKAAEFEVAEGRKRRSKKNKKKKGSRKPRGAQNGKKQSKRRRPDAQKKSRKKKN